ncbi:MAG: DinB family protein, partial [Alphaproteobacteria bacterium]
MTLVEHMRAMARNNAWANHRLLTACGKLSEADYKATRTSFFPSVHLTLNHVLIVDWYYLDALEDGGLGQRAYETEEPCASFAALDAAQRASDRKLIGYTDRLAPETLAERVDLDRGPRGIKRETAAA